MKMVPMRVCWAANVATPVHRNMFQGRNLMVSHLIADGGDFLPPQRSNSSNQELAAWAKEAMLYYKKTGCLETRKELLVHYMDTFVNRLATKIAASVLYKVEQEDLKQVAFFALDNYIDKFDPSLNYKFESFARLRIEGAMLDFIRREDPASRLARSRTKMLARGIEAFRAVHGRKPADEELQHALQLDDKEFIAVMRDFHVPTTITIQSTEENDSGEGVVAMSIEVKNRGCEDVERKDLYSWLCETLGVYDKLIVVLTYTEGLTMLEIGNTIGYSESRVSQRLKHIHDVLKENITDNPEEWWLRAS